jgi:hypothetical protein
VHWLWSHSFSDLFICLGTFKVPYCWRLMILDHLWLWRHSSCCLPHLQVMSVQSRHLAFPGGSWLGDTRIKKPSYMSAESSIRSRYAFSTAGSTAAAPRWTSGSRGPPLASLACLSADANHFFQCCANWSIVPVVNGFWICTLLF